MMFLAFLLHHANRVCKDREFYAIKYKLLKMYGKAVGFDVQHIEGKSCYTCDGTGVWHGWYHRDTCNHCAGSGYYKMPQWVLLQKYQCGKYRFHRPIERKFVKKNPYVAVAADSSIVGYIEHYHSRYSYLAVYALYFLFDRVAFAAKLKRWKNDLGFGWYVYWWYPRNWLNNAVYVWKKGWPRRIKYAPTTPASYDNGGNFEELPF